MCGACPLGGTPERHQSRNTCLNALWRRPLTALLRQRARRWVTNLWRRPLSKRWAGSRPMPLRHAWPPLRRHLWPLSSASMAAPCPRGRQVNRQAVPRAALSCCRDAEARIRWPGRYCDVLQRQPRCIIELSATHCSIPCPHGIANDKDVVPVQTVCADTPAICEQEHTMLIEHIDHVAACIAIFCKHALRCTHRSSVACLGMPCHREPCVLSGSTATRSHTACVHHL